MGKQKTYSWEFKLQMVHVLAKGTHNMSQISRDQHVTRSLLYAWIRLYQERGEAAFVPNRATAAPPEIERLRELMPTVSVRKLCTLLNINRQWYYQHRCCSVQDDRDQALGLALHELRHDFAGDGYRCMTKARKPARLEDPS